MVKIDEFYAPQNVVTTFKSLCYSINIFCMNLDSLTIGLMLRYKRIESTSPRTYLKTLEVKKEDIDNYYQVLIRYSLMNTYILTPEDRAELIKWYNNAIISFKNSLATITAYFNQPDRKVIFSNDVFYYSDLIRSRIACVQEIAYDLRLSSIEVDEDEKERVYFSLTKNDILTWQKIMNKVALKLSCKFVINITKSKLNTLR